MIDLKNPKEVASIIDQTLLQPTATSDQVQEFCQEAAALGFASVCIAPCWVKVAARAIASSGVWICTVAGFPFGFEPWKLKVQTVQAALAAGADEIDYVVNLGAVKGGDYELIAAEMEARGNFASWRWAQAWITSKPPPASDQQEHLWMMLNFSLNAASPLSR